MALMRTYREMKTVVGRYEREVWEYEQKLKRNKSLPKDRPKKRSIRERIRQLQADYPPAVDMQFCNCYI